MRDFAALESRLSATVVRVFGNVWLVVGGQAVRAVLDRGLDSLGEFGALGEARDRITVMRADAECFASGMPVVIDENRYSADAILAMPRLAWALDRMAEDDGHLVSWWLR
jgi:hypothetical protein